PPPPPPPPPSPAAGRTSTAVRMAREVAHLRRTTKLLLVALLVTAGGFAGLQWKAGRDRARELTQLRTRADSLSRESQTLFARFRNELQVLRDALAQSQAETARLRRELATGGVDDATMARLRAELEDAERRQRGLASASGVDYRAIARRNQDAVAIVLVEFSDIERFTGTAFAVDSQGTLVTNKHVLVGVQGDRTPRRIAVKFSGSRQWFPGRLVGVSEEADVGVLKVDIRGGTPRVAGLASDLRGLERGDPVAIIGYPLGLDLPMEGQGLYAAAEPTLTVGTVSKVLTGLIQVDGFGAPGSSGSPVFDREGRVVALLYGGQRESEGKIIYATPAVFIGEYLKRLGLRG
ncbi:MAG: trypsin-like peptidase domain-containing protein, partial [Gemmatimonadales bacterium]